MINYREKIDKKLLLRQGIFIVIILILLVITVRNMATGQISESLAASGFLGATAAGLLLSRMFKIIWHQEKRQVISQLDAVGGIFLTVYIIFEIGKKWIFSHWLHDATLNAFGLVVVMGLLLGRFLGTTVRIQDVLSQND